MRTIHYLCVSILFLTLVYSASGQIPRMISYQGVLTDSTGTPRPDGTYSFTFRLYQTSSGGSALWTEQKTLQVQHGLFSTNFGDQVVFPASLAFDRPYWLGIQVAANPEMSPRVALTSAGYSLRSIKSDTAQFALASSQGVTGSGTVNYIPKWTPSGTQMGNSLIQDFGTSMSIGTFPSGGGLNVVGDLGASPSQYFSQLSLSTPNSDGHLIRLSFVEGPDAKAQIEAGRSATASDGYLAFRVRTSSGGFSELMRLTPNGNVGIGTTGSAARLGVSVANEGDLALRLTSGANSFLDISPTGSANTVISTANNRNLILDPGTANVGVGITAPGARIDATSSSATTPTGRFRKGGTAPTTTFAAVHVENFTASGEAAWMRSASASNTAPVVTLTRHPSATSNFIDGINWDGTNPSVRKFHIDANGTYTAGSDFAEAFEASGGKASYEQGDVVVLSEKNPRAIEKSSTPYDTRVAGIYSTRPGVLGADKDGVTRMDENDIPVAIIGIVPTKVSDENGMIQSGDLLTTSSVPGYAMKASPVIVNGMKIYPTGTIIGKALEQLTGPHGLIKVLVTLR